MPHNKQLEQKVALSVDPVQTARRNFHISVTAVSQHIAELAEPFVRATYLLPKTRPVSTGT
jgi:hypothetical protein